MRTSWLSVSGVLVLATLTGCTTKGVEIPVLAGPSTYARSILIKAEKDTLLQNGVDTTRITVTALGPTGQSEAVTLRAQIFVADVPQDFGTLSSKNFVTPATVIYTAPAASTTGVQPSHIVTIGFTPQDSGDFRSEFTRTIDLLLIPPGVILPTNPALLPSFTVTPSTPQAFNVVSFDASATTNAGASCRDTCTFAWNFGDGTTGTGMTTAHTFRTAGTFQVLLTVTDSRGAQATAIQAVAVAPSTPPTAGYQVSPATVGVNQDAFFNAGESRPAAGRTITRYDWDFGDGSTGSGVAVSHRWSAPGSFSVVLTVTDDAGAQAQITKSYPVTATGGLTAALTFQPSNPRPGQPVAFNGSGSASTTSTIVSYKFNYGDGSEETGTSPTQTHIYAVPGTYVATLVVTDAQGRTATAQVSVTVAVAP